MIKRHAASTYTLPGAFKYAADIDDDGDITINDYTAVKSQFKNKADMYAVPSTGPAETPVDVTDPASNPGTIKFNGSPIHVSKMLVITEQNCRTEKYRPLAFCLA